MSFSPCPPLRHYFTYNAIAAVGGKLYTYLGGTTTPEVVYKNDIGTPHENPIILDANGSAPLYLDDSKAYKFVIKSAQDDLIDTVDGITAPVGGGASDGKVMVSQNDSTPSYLSDKITTSSLLKSITGAGGDEKLNIEVAKIPLSADDPTRDYLGNKIIADSPLVITLDSTVGTGKRIKIGLNQALITHNNLDGLDAGNVHPASSIQCGDGIDFGSGAGLCDNVYGKKFRMEMGALMRQQFVPAWNNGPLIALEANGDNYGMAVTYNGGIAVRMFAQGAIAKGSLLTVSSTLPNGYVTLNPSYGAGAIGVAYHSANDGEVVWMVVKGRCVVRIADLYTPTLGQPLVVSNSTGCAMPVPAWNADAPATYNQSWERAMARIGVASSTVADGLCEAFLT